MEGDYMPKRKARPVPEPGTTFEKQFKGSTYKMVVVKTADGVGYKVGNKVYGSPTAAAKAVQGSDQEINGPRFWQMDA
jgi:hypothetical protein